MNQHDKAEQGGRKRPLRQADASLRAHLIRRQNLVYLSLIATGVVYSAGSPFTSPALVAEGVAFIMVGFVGLVMSLTTVDIGKSLKDATHEEGEMTRTIIREAVDALGAQLGKQMEERDQRMEERLDRMGASMEAMSADVKAMSADVKAMSADVKAMSADVKAMSADNRDFFRQMLEAQNRILEKVS